MDQISLHIPSNILVFTSDKDFEVTDPLINFCNSMPQLKLTNRDRLNPHGKQVVDIVSQEGLEGLGEFIKIWRINFIESMQPKYLPSGWRVDHTV